MAPLMSRLYKVLQLPVQAALCPLCRDGETESVEHFILQCPVLDSERREFLRLLRLAMQPLGGPGSHVLQHLQAHPAALLDAVLGKQPPVPTSDGPGQGSKLHENTCAQVLWAWDKLVKNLILVMWRKRKALGIGHRGLSSRAGWPESPGGHSCVRIRSSHLSWKFIRLMTG